MKDGLELIVIEELEALGYDLVEFRRGGSSGRPVFDIRIDRKDLAKVTVDDCARVSRALESRLDAPAGVAGVRDQRYVLEVSSPGLDRKLARAADWVRFAGRKANVKSAALGGRVEVEIEGVEGAPGAEVVTVRDAAGVVHHVALTEVAEARLAVHWS
jgi:ribosome maturation factor RimP